MNPPEIVSTEYFLPRFWQKSALPTVSKGKLIALSLAFCLANTSNSLSLAFGGSNQLSDPATLKASAFEKYVEGDLEEARILYEQAIQSAERSYGENSSFVADLCFEVGSIALEEGNFACAEKYLELATKKKPQSITARIKYSDLLMMRGRSDAALKQIEKALEYDRSSPEARQALVRYMNHQAVSKSTKSAAASLAATMEAYNLRMAGHNTVQKTLAYISNWRNGLIKPVPTQASPAIAAAVPSTPVPKPPPPQAQAKPKPAKPTTAPAKPTTAPAKPAPKPKPKESASNAKPVIPPPPPTQKESKPRSKPASAPAGMVPPPPPMVPVFRTPPPPPTGFKLETDARIKEDTKKPDKEQVKEQAKPKKKPVIQDSEPDYLLDWADVSSKKKNK